MKPSRSLQACVVLAVLLMIVVLEGGCERSTTVAEGVIYTVSYRRADGQTEGFTRVNHRALVPGGNGSWNIDAYGRLTQDFLIITYPQRRGLGPHVIPVSRLLSIQFGDGGIKTMGETRSVSP